MELPHSDPLAANLLPPRHAFESESDDDDPRPREPALVLTADLELVGGQAIPEEATLLVFVGVEGRYFGRGLRGQSGPLATIFTERRQPNAEGIAAEPVARSPVRPSPTACCLRRAASPVFVCRARTLMAHLSPIARSPPSTRSSLHRQKALF